MTHTLNVFGMSVECNGNCDKTPQTFFALLSIQENIDIVTHAIFQSMKSASFLDESGIVSVTLIDPEDGEIDVVIGWINKNHTQKTQATSDLEPALA